MNVEQSAEIVDKVGEDVGVIEEVSDVHGEMSGELDCI